MLARSSQKNSTQPSSNKRAPIKVYINGSRSPLPAPSDRLSAKSNAPKVASDQTKVITPSAPPSVLVSRAIPKEDKRPVLGTAKAM
ncbi:hypothetical protein BC936DRAFT_149155 [Jimgerdemannia flammicorona]|uniref:Uncharacterized protein n=1 Tax=Jimgerdemannia flammicorona TaxID=994334 RepID=A0A433D1F6_9FUNG|nr:hypothetical protein BC936DRAFT_149155 [Jimgerdemannia flammicorona]